METVTVTGEGAERLEQGTGIVYRKWVRAPGSLRPGQLVRVTAPGGYEGCALWEPAGPVALRVVSHWGCPYSSAEEAILDRLESALRARERSRLAETGSYRLVNSDGDLLSGLIVDVFGGEVAVLQSSSAAIDVHIQHIARAVSRLTGASAVYEKSSQRSRKAIGLEPRRRWLIGRKRRTIVEEWGVRFIVDVEMGQKTGFYLDQRFNRLELRRYVSRGDTVLDLFSYTGGFGIHAAHAGAGRVVFIEEDPEAARVLRENLRLNNVESYDIRVTSIWNLIGARLGRFNIIVVDPPAFIQSGDRESVRRGLGAYYKSYSWALEQADTAFVAYLSSCSYFLKRDMFVRLVRDVMADHKVDYRMLGSLRGAAPDHSHRAAEYLDYLKGAFIYGEKRGRG